MQLQIHNSKTNKKEIFYPIDLNNIRMYVCGPTVYNEIHVGNARSAIVFDILFRVLKAVYPNVTYTRNITDIDDKIITRAKEENKDIKEVSEYWTESYSKNCQRLNLLKPTHEPKATETVKEIIEFIESLIKNGYAYENEGSVFFNVNKLEEYGSLSNNKEILENHRIAKNELKTNQQDFVLWKKAEEGTPSWSSPWSEGRPGWHIECSAMSKKFLGESFDIHAGGADLLFPHHENEQAQNIGCNGCNSGPKYWMHNAMLLFDGEKMSKSIGNIILLSKALEKLHPIFFKFYILNTHYRHMLMWSDDSINALANKFDIWMMHLGFHFKNADTNHSEEDIAELLNDLNTPGFFAKFDERLSEAIASDNTQEFRKLAGLLTLLGLNIEITEVSAQVKALADTRWEKKQDKAFDEADNLRAQIEDLGFIILDTSDGYSLKPKFKSII